MPKAARLGDSCSGHGCFPATPIVAGSGNVFIGDTPYKSETFDCGKDAAQEKATFLKITPLSEPEPITWTVPYAAAFDQQKAMTQAVRQDKAFIPVCDKMKQTS